MRQIRGTHPLYFSFVGELVPFCLNLEVIGKNSKQIIVSAFLCNTVTTFVLYESVKRDSIYEQYRAQRLFVYVYTTDLLFNFEYRNSKT